MALSRTIMFVFVTLLCVACAGSRSPFVGSNGAGDIALDTRSPGELPPPRVSGALAADGADKLLVELRNSAPEMRASLRSRLIEMGPAALPYVRRFSAFNKNDDIALDLLYIENALERAGATAGGGQPEHTQPPSAQNAPPESTDAPQSPADLPPKPPGAGDPNAWAPDPELTALYEGREDFDANEADRFVRARFAAAYEAMQRGESERARDICEAILTLAPESRYRASVQQLLSQARGARAVTGLVAARTVISERAIRLSDAKTPAFERPLRVDIFIKNIGTSTLKVDLGDGSPGRGESLLILDLELICEDVDGATVTQSARINRILRGDAFTLAPDESRRLSQQLTDLSDLPLDPGAELSRTLRIRASLRPALFSRQERGRTEFERVYRPIAVDEGEVAVFPAGFDLEGALADPALFMTRCIADREHLSLFLASTLIERKDIRLALDILLAGDIEQGGIAMRRARLRCASHIVGRDLGRDPDKWREWWQTHRLEY